MQTVLQQLDTISVSLIFVIVVGMLLILVCVSMVANDYAVFKIHKDWGHWRYTVMRNYNCRLVHVAVPGPEYRIIGNGIYVHLTPYQALRMLKKMKRMKVSCRDLRIATGRTLGSP